MDLCVEPHITVFGLYLEQACQTQVTEYALDFAVDFGLGIEANRRLSLW